MLTISCSIRAISISFVQREVSALSASMYSFFVYSVAVFFFFGGANPFRLGLGCQGTIKVSSGTQGRLRVRGLGSPTVLSQGQRPTAVRGQRGGKSEAYGREFKFVFFVSFFHRFSLFFLSRSLFFLFFFLCVLLDISLSLSLSFFSFSSLSPPAALI